MKKFFVMMLSLLVLVLMVSSALAADKIVIKLSTPDPETSPITQSARHFAKYVEENSKGRVTVQIFPDGVLFSGNGATGIKMMGSGTLEAATLSSILYTSFDPKFAAINIPYLFDSPDDVMNFVNGPLGNEYIASLDKIGIKVIGFWYRPFRQITNSRRPLAEPKDFESLKLRVPPSPLFVEFFKAMGANPTPMAFGEVYNALQLKTIDGQENPLGVPVSARFYEVQKYVTISDHIADVWVVGFSKQVWDRYPKDVQELLIQAAKETNIWKIEYEKQMADDYLKIMKEKGMTVTYLTPAQKQAFRAMARSVYPKFESLIGKEFYDKVMKLVK